MVKLLNYTPHTVTVFDGYDPLVTYAPVGLAWATQTSETVAELFVDTGYVPVKHMAFGTVEGLPESAEQDTYFIVSAITAQAAKVTNHPLRDRLLVVADPVRNTDGQIVGCRSFSVI
jgi:hypothetical protein